MGTDQAIPFDEYLRPGFRLDPHRREGQVADWEGVCQQDRGYTALIGTALIGTISFPGLFAKLDEV